MAPSDLKQTEINYGSEMNNDCHKEGDLFSKLKNASNDDLPRSLDDAAEGGQYSCKTDEFAGSQLVPVEGPRGQEHVLVVHSETPKIDQKDGQPLGPYEIFVTSPQLRTEVGVALIDTGAQVSLIARTSLHPKVAVKENGIYKINGITGNVLDIKGKVEVNVNNNGHHKFHVIEELPRKLDIVLGQDWLAKNHFMLQKEIIPALSEKIVQLPTREKGIRYIESQEIQPGLLVARCCTKCVDNKVTCLLVNTTHVDQVIEDFPNLNKPPRMERFQQENKQRNALLKENLRLNHIKEGAEDIRKICQEYAEIFRLPGDKLTATTAAQHSIPTPSIPEGRCITLKNYRLAEAHKDEIDKQVVQMLDEGIIRPSQSEWNFPLLVVPKKMDASGEKKWRICIDFRRLNDVTVGDSYPLPNVQDILDKVGRARYFSALDCASGYLQVPLKPEDRCKTAFSTPSGHYEYVRMPFGLKSAPATYQRMMNAVLRDSIGNRCMVYMDDIIVMGETLEEHNDKLREVFSHLKQWNIKIEPDKCEFLKIELNYLGHVITAEGIKPDPRKISSVVNFPVPRNTTDVKSFLGLSGYYRKFIAKFSAIAKPLTELLKKNTPWSWSEKEQTSFEKLKERLITTPVLQYPDFSKPFLLTTDASGYAIGAVLSQRKVGQDLPVAYASRTFNGAELNYSTVEKELLAIVWAVKHFRPYLIGRKFQVLTDHKGLTWIFRVKDPSSRLLRWRMLLEEYEYEVVYKPGKQNLNADSLSRYPEVNLCDKQDPEIDEERKRKVISEMHDCPIGGHQGVSRTLERIKLYLEWKGMEQDIRDYIKKCVTCQQMKLGKIAKEPLQVTDTQEFPWNKLALDIVGPLEITSEKNKYILSCQDNLSKYLVAVPLQSQTAEEIAEKLVKFIILIYGIPTIILTDQGMNFCSDVFRRLCILLKIEKVQTTAYHPESNGALERAHATLMNYLRCYVSSKQEWDQLLPFACFSYNTTPHSITGYTPYEVLFGRKCNIPGILQKGIHALYNYDDIVSVIKRQIQEASETARSQLVSFKKKQSEKDKKVGQCLQLKDLVWLRKEQRNKLEPHWEGTYEVQEIQYPNVKIQKIGKRKQTVVHMNRLKPYCC
jgi:hypothetical protein